MKDETREILYWVVGMHWDIKSCDCPVCFVARASGIYPMERYARRGPETPKEAIALADAVVLAPGMMDATLHLAKPLLKETTP